MTKGDPHQGVDAPAPTRNQTVIASSTDHLHLIPDIHKECVGVITKTFTNASALKGSAARMESRAANVLMVSSQNVAFSFSAESTGLTKLSYVTIICGPISRGMLSFSLKPKKGIKKFGHKFRM